MKKKIKSEWDKILKELKDRFRIPEKILKTNNLSEWEIDFYSEVLKINRSVLIEAIKENKN